MRTRTPIIVTVAALMLVGSTPGFLHAQGGELEWSDYRLGQFISTRDKTPGQILDLDNNGAILLACREGCTRATLEAAGVAAVDSQLELLRGWSLLVEDEGELRAAIPVLDGAAAELLGKRAAELAEQLAADIAPDVAGVVAALDSEGWGEHAYAVISSYILDGRVWLFFNEMSLVGRRYVSRGRAPWGGEAWAYVSEREIELQSSAVRRESIGVQVAWVRPLRPLVTSLLGGPLGMRTLFVEHVEKGEPASAELRKNLVGYRVLDESGLMTVPVISEDPEDKLFRACDDLSTRVAEGVIEKLDRSTLVAELGLERESQALIITYHEVMWSLMESLVESGYVELPKAIRDPESAQPADMGQLVVMTRAPVSASDQSDRDEE